MSKSNCLLKEGCGLVLHSISSVAFFGCMPNSMWWRPARDAIISPEVTKSLSVTSCITRVSSSSSLFCMRYPLSSNETKPSRSSYCWSTFSPIKERSLVHTTVFSFKNSKSDTFSPVVNCVSTFGIIFTCNNLRSESCVSGSKIRIESTSFPKSSTRYGFSFPKE